MSGPCAASRSSKASGNKPCSHSGEALTVRAQQTRAVHTLRLPVRIYWILELTSCLLNLNWKSQSYRKQGKKQASSHINPRVSPRATTNDSSVNGAGFVKAKEGTEGFSALESVGGFSTKSEVCQDAVVTAATVPTADPATGQHKVSAPNVYYLMMLLTFKKMKYQNAHKLGSSQPICCGPYSSVRLRL